MVSNKLVINDDKTHLVVMAKKGQGAARETVTLQAGAHNMQPVQTVKLLGGHISEDLKFEETLANI